MVGPLLFAQLSELASQIPALLERLRELIVDKSNNWFGQIFPGGKRAAEQALQNMTKEAAGNITSLMQSAWTSGKAMFSFFSLILITPVVTFFLLKDWNHLINKINRLLPRDHAPIIRLLTKRIDRSIAGFIHGQVIISIIVGFFYSVALTVVGLKFGLLIGVTAGVLNIIPFLGSLVGFLISGTTAVVQFWPEWQSILIVFGIFLFGQLVDANLLTPKIIGEKIKLHPVWLIFALIASGYLFGLLGMLIAIPLAAAIGVLVRYSLDRYLDSELYVGTRRPKQATEGSNSD